MAEPKLQSKILDSKCSAPYCPAWLFGIITLPRHFLGSRWARLRLEAVTRGVTCTYNQRAGRAAAGAGGC